MKLRTLYSVLGGGHQQRGILRLYSTVLWSLDARAGADASVIIGERSVGGPERALNVFLGRTGTEA